MPGNLQTGGGGENSGQISTEDLQLRITAIILLKYRIMRFIETGRNFPVNLYVRSIHKNGKHGDSP